MRHVLSCALGCALVFALVGATRADDKPQWVTIKGQVVFPDDKKLPEREPLNVTQDKDALPRRKGRSSTSRFW